jgi:hypothetical protein
MRQCVLWAGLLGFLVFSGVGSGEPVKGSRGFVVKLAGQSMGSEGNIVPGKAEFKETFMGGRRACVIVKGDHDPVVDLGVYVYDANERLVAKDEGRGDFVAAIWYPPRDASYRIVVHNPASQWNKCYIVVK